VKGGVTGSLGERKGFGTSPLGGGRGGGGLMEGPGDSVEGEFMFVFGGEVEKVEEVLGGEKGCGVGKAEELGETRDAKFPKVL